jgi:hypothetical protein
MFWGGVKKKVAVLSRTLLGWLGEVALATTPNPTHLKALLLRLLLLMLLADLEVMPAAALRPSCLS